MIFSVLIIRVALTRPSELCHGENGVLYLVDSMLTGVSLTNTLCDATSQARRDAQRLRAGAGRKQPKAKGDVAATVSSFDFEGLHKARREQCPNQSPKDCWGVTISVLWPAAACTVMLLNREVNLNVGNASHASKQ